MSRSSSWPSCGSSSSAPSRASSWAPGVGDRASWVPNVLVAETYTILPIGFALCLWGASIGRLLAAVCAAASLGLAVVAVITLSTPESSVMVLLPLLIPPGLALLLCAWRLRRQ